VNTLLSESLGDLRRHFVPACQYVFAAMAALALYRWSAYFLDVFSLPETAAPTVSAVRLTLVLYLAVASSVIQALFFASLGAAIARPMWKYKGWRDALTRFFMPWLIINLFLVMLMDIHARLIGGGVYDPALMLELLLMVVHAAALPLGAAVMYWGALRWQELPQMTVPLTRFLQLTLLPFGPTHAPTGSTFLSFETTAIFVLYPASLAMFLISTIFSLISGTSSSKSLLTSPVCVLETITCGPLVVFLTSDMKHFTLSPCLYLSPGTCS